MQSCPQANVRVKPRNLQRESGIGDIEVDLVADPGIIVAPETVTGVNPDSSRSEIERIV